MLACAREIQTVVRQPCPVYLFSQTDASAEVPAGSLEFSFGLQGSLKLGAKGIVGAGATLNFSSINFDVGEGEFGKEQELSVSIDVPRRTLIEAGMRSQGPLAGRHEDMVPFGGIWIPTDDFILEFGVIALFGFDAEVNLSEIGRRIGRRSEAIDTRGYPFEKPTR